MGRGSRRYGFGAILSKTMGAPRRAYPRRKGPGDAFNIRVQGRIEGPVMAGVVANKIYEGRAGTAGVMKVRRGVQPPVVLEARLRREGE